VVLKKQVLSILTCTALCVWPRSIGGVRGLGVGVLIRPYLRARRTIGTMGDPTPACEADGAALSSWASRRQLAPAVCVVSLPWLNVSCAGGVGGVGQNNATGSRSARRYAASPFLPSTLVAARCPAPHTAPRYSG
jgi:hypothetical protein